MRTSTSLLITAGVFLGLGFEYLSAGAAIFWSIVLVALAWGDSR